MRYKGLWYNPDKPEPERIEHDNTIFIFSFVFSSFRAFVIIKFFHKMTLTANKRSGQEIRIALPARSLPTRRHPESFRPDKSTCFAISPAPADHLPAAPQPLKNTIRP